MATGDVTSTYEGTFAADSAALLTELDTLNTGAATAGSDTTTIILVPEVSGKNIHVYTIARAA
mgnify:CR=1 FL=1